MVTYGHSVYLKNGILDLGLNMYLVCGTCGDGFDGEQDKQHDNEFGTCPSCMIWLKSRNEREWRRLEKLVISGLTSEKNKKSFMQLSPTERRRIISKMIDDGILAWEITSGPRLKEVSMDVR